MSHNTAIGASRDATRKSHLSYSVATLELQYCDPDVNDKTYIITWNDSLSVLQTDGLSCHVIVDELTKKSRVPPPSASGTAGANLIIGWIHNQQLQTQMKQEKATIDAVVKLYESMLELKKVQIDETSDNWHTVLNIVKSVVAGMALKERPSKHKRRVLTQAIHEIAEKGTPLDASVIGVIIGTVFTSSAADFDNLDWL